MTVQPVQAKRKPGTACYNKRTGLWQIRIRLADGSRIRSKPLPAGTSETQARKMAVEFQEKHRGKTAAEFGRHSAKNPTPAKSRDKTCDAWVDAWHADRVARGLTTALDTLSHWRIHLSGILGAKHPKHWQRADFRKVSATLSTRAQHSEISRKTARNIWTTATGMAKEAQSSNLDTLQCREDNPSEGVKGPERGEQLALQYLYPAEADQFLRCEVVPMRWRRLVAVAIYTYCRAGELRALTWDDVDLDHGTISVTKSVERRTRTLKSTKTKSPRRIPIEPELLPLLQAMRKEADGKGAVLTDVPSERDLSRGIRRWLVNAKVDRASLHNAGPSTKPIRFHDMRATGITWAAARGDDPIRIKQRAGHTSFSTTERYLRVLDEVGSFGLPFGPLPESLLVAVDRVDIGPGTGHRAEIRQKPRISARFLAGRTGLEPQVNATLSEDSEVRGRSVGDDLPPKPPRVPEVVSAGPSLGPNDRVPGMAVQSSSSSGIVAPQSPVDDALALALTEATRAGQWALVGQLAAELQARRGQS